MGLLGPIVLVLIAAAPATAQTHDEPAAVVRGRCSCAPASACRPPKDGCRYRFWATLRYPAAALGIAAGATAYPLRLGIITFGAGVSVSAAKGKGESLTITTGSGATARHHRDASHADGNPQRHAASVDQLRETLGWSYLSAGLGVTESPSSADATGTMAQVIVPESWNRAHQFRRRRAVVHEEIISAPASTSVS